MGGVSYRWVESVTDGWSQLQMGGVSYRWVESVTDGRSQLQMGGVSRGCVGRVIRTANSLG